MSDSPLQRGGSSRMIRIQEVPSQAAIYFTLWTLAVAHPLYSILVQSPEFFAAHRASGLSLLLASLVISILLPGLMFLIELGLSGLHQRVGSCFRLLIILVLLLAIALQVSVILPLPSSLRLAVAVLCAAIGLYWLQPSRSADMVLFALLPIVLLSPAYWYVSSGLHSSVSGAEGMSVSLPAGTEPNGIPVVLIVLDQLATAAVIDAEGGIDKDRFPALADLMDTATWYRNATTVATATLNAVPSILTGVRPKFKRTPPILKFHPMNLFRLMHGQYAFNVFESLTVLSPEDAEHNQKSQLEIVESMLADCAIVAGHIVLPAVLRRHLPAVDGQPAFFAGVSEADFEKKGARVDCSAYYGSRRHDQVRDFLAGMNGGDRTLHFIHHVNPHHPWQFFPSNRTYSEKSFVPSLPSWDRPWPMHPGVAIAARQRYLLQVLGVDKTIGEIVLRMREVDLFDKSMMVLVSDHGNNFVPNVQLRKATPETYKDVIYVPLIIKYPHQTTGRIVDENVETIDILPTIAEVLGMKILPTDGESLLTSPRTPRLLKRVLTYSETGKPVEFPAEGGERFIRFALCSMGWSFPPRKGGFA